MKPHILITNCSLIENPHTLRIGQPMFISIQDDTITSIGPMKNLESEESWIKIDGQGQLAMSGLINGHCHAPMTLFRGLADDLSLPSWLNEYIFPAEAQHVNREMVYWCAKLAAAEMLLSGTTTVADAYFFEHEAVKAFLEAGIRSVPAQGIVDFPAPGVPDQTQNIDAAADFIDTFFRNEALVSPAAFVHSPYTCSNKTLVKAKQMANQKGVKLFIHLAETRNEQQRIEHPMGPTPVQHLNALDILDSDTICIHCVWVNQQDIDILAEKKCSVVACPQSNLKLASGIAPYTSMIEKGIPVGLGTDGPASNNSLDMFQEMDISAKIQKIRNHDPTEGKAEQILASATITGAQALGLPENIGTLVPGNKADIVLIDCDKPHLQPFYNTSTLVYSADGSDVQSVIVNGKLVVHNREIITFDLDETKARVRELGGTLAE